MEAVLYDLYLAQVMMDENFAYFSNDSARKQKLLNSVLEKHGVNEQQLDTSLAWYNSDIDRYLKINSAVEKRYTSELAQLKRKVEVVDKEKPQTDSINLCLGENSFFLRAPWLFSDSLFFENDSLPKQIQSFNWSHRIIGVHDTILP